MGDGICWRKERSSGICFRCRFLMIKATRCSIYNFHFSQSGPSLGMHCLAHLAWVSLVDSQANVLACWLPRHARPTFRSCTDYTIMFCLNLGVDVALGPKCFPASNSYLSCGVHVVMSYRIQRLGKVILRDAA